MRRFVLFCIGVLCAVSIFAQTSITEFMGVPVDGSTKDLVRKLKAKGFTPAEEGSEVLYGAFNGEEVVLTMDTNEGKVFRVLLVEKKSYSDEGIKARYNELFSQFVENPKYAFVKGSFFIEDDTDVSFETTVNGTTFQSFFIFSPTSAEEEELDRKLQTYMSSKYTEEELLHPSDEVIKDNNNYYVTLLKEQESLLYKRVVRLSISSKGGAYRIAIAFVNSNNAVESIEL